MVTLMSQFARRQGDTDGDGASASMTSWFPGGAALGVAGLATASTAITCMVISQSSEPPAVDDDSSSCYLLALSAGLFYTGIAELGASVWLPAGRKLAYASLVPLAAAVGLFAAATFFW